MRQHVEFRYGRGAWQRTSRRLQAHFVAHAARIAAGLAADLKEGWSSLQDIACPTLAVMGLETAPVSLRATELVAETIPGARLVMVPDAGHMAFLTDPHIVDPLILRHLDAAERADAAAGRPPRPQQAA
jgi:pimeloyl-ACP methyl ester carboxylesterase